MICQKSESVRPVQQKISCLCVRTNTQTNIFFPVKKIHRKVLCYTLGFPWDDWYAPPNFNPKSLEDLTMKCNAEIPTANITNCKSNTKYGYCLFNLKEDPCEVNDLSVMHPEILQQLKSRLDY